MKSNHVGEYWIGGYEAHGDERTSALSLQRHLLSRSPMRRS